MNKINILFLTCSLGIGGTEKHIFQLVSNLNKEKFNPVICCLYEVGSIGNMLVDEEGIKVYCNLLRNRWDISGVWKLMRIFRNENIHILYIVNSPLTMFYGIICVKFTGVDACLTRITVTKPISHSARRWITNKIMLSFIDMIIAQADSHKEYLINHDGFKEDKIEVIYNGVQLANFMPVAGGENQKQIIGIPEGAPVVGVVARLSPEKGLSFFLDSAKKILNYIPNAHFIIVGDGPEKIRLENMTCELPIQSNVHFLGMRKDIPKVISLFDVAVMPSNIDNFSNAVLEYMAASKPVVATNVGSISEQVIDGETGFLIAPGDHEALADRILKLLHNPELAKKMGRAGQRLVEKKFTLQKMVEKYEVLFEGLTN